MKSIFKYIGIFLIGISSGIYITCKYYSATECLEHIVDDKLTHHDVYL